MKITEIEVHEITLEYEDFLAYQLIGLTQPPLLPIFPARL